MITVDLQKMPSDFQLRMPGTYFHPPDASSSHLGFLAPLNPTRFPFLILTRMASPGTMEDGRKWDEMGPEMIK